MNVIYELQTNGIGMPQSRERLVVVPARPEVEGRDGRRYANPDPQGIVDLFRRRAAKLPIDIEHSTHVRGPQGLPAPAVGWVVDLAVEDGAVVAKVEWNDEGNALLDSRAYKYYSPSYLLRDGKIAGLLSLALTNLPNLDLPELNRERAGDGRKGEDMEITDRDRICKKLGLELNSADAQILVEIGRWHSDAEYRAALNRAETAEAKVREAEGKAFKDAVDKAVSEAVAQGKIAPAAKEYHKSVIGDEAALNRFKAFVAASPVVLPNDGGLKGKRPPEAQGRVVLNAEQTKVAEMVGLTDDERTRAKEDLGKWQW